MLAQVLIQVLWVLVQFQRLKKLLEKAALTLEDIDLIEANEAFAAQSLAVDRELQF